MKRKIDLTMFIFGIIIGLTIGTIIFAIVAFAQEPEPQTVKREIQYFQETVTLVPLRIEPVFIPELALGDPEEVKTEPTPIATVIVKEGKLTKSNGRVQGPTNQETYYNLPMRKVIQSMVNRGYSEEEYPYWVREDGVKMLGDYVMVAADLELHPKGTIVETSLGQGIVCDTGDFAKYGDIYDIAVDW